MDEDEDDDFGGSGGKGRGAAHKEDSELFINEVIELLQIALKKNLESSNIILEINSRKHANNIQIDDLCFYLAKAMLVLPISS